MTILAEPNVKIAAGRPYFGRQELSYVMDAVESGWVTMGRWVDIFERTFAEYLGVKHAISCSSGTAALHLAMTGLDIDYRDEVIVPTCTFIATVNAVRYVRAVPVFVDSERNRWGIDPVALREAITPKTRAVILAHLYGVSGAIEDIRAICRQRGVVLVEDAAEALGASVGNSLAGTIGEVGCFSFYGNKTITTGEGGMVVTNNDALAERIRLLRGQGQEPGKRYWHIETGFNYRMTDIQAALGVAQMEHLAEILEKRRTILAAYREHLRGVELQAARYPTQQHGAWAVAVLLPPFADAGRVAVRLEAMGIETRPVFPPIHTMPMYGLEAAAYPVAADLARRGLVLPCHPGLSVEDVQYICYQLREAIYGANLHD